MKTVAEAYDKDPEYEWNRLVRDPYHSVDPYHSLEFLVFMHHVKKHFPKKGKILDAGGGPGRYAIKLCKMGYEVTLLDLSPGCIKTAKEKFKKQPKKVRERLNQFVVGNVKNLVPWIKWLYS